MISAGLRTWQQDNRFRISGSTVYGVYQSVGFSVAEEDGGKLFIFMLSGGDNAFDTIEDMLGAQRGDLHEVQVGDVENYLALFFDESAGEMPARSMSALLDFVAANCRSCGFRAPNICVKCGAPATKRAFHDNMVQPMCAQCREEEKNGGAPARQPAPVPAPAPVRSREPERDYGDSIVPKQSSYDESYDEYAEFEHKRRMPEEREYYDDRDYYDRARRARDYDEESGSSKGVLGALLGAVAGLVPYFITVLIPFQMGMLCCVAGYLSVIGYIAFKGKRVAKPALVTSIVVSELVSIIAVLLVNLFSGFNGSLASAFSSFGANFPWINLALAILGSLLGAAIAMDKLDVYTYGE